MLGFGFTLVKVKADAFTLTRNNLNRTDIPLNLIDSILLQVHRLHGCNYQFHSLQPFCYILFQVDVRHESLDDSNLRTNISVSARARCSPAQR